MQKIVRALPLLLLIVPCLCAISILDFGAVPSSSSDSICLINSNAITKAILYANASSLSSTDRTVLVPPNYHFYFLYVEVSGIYNVTIQIDGVLSISNHLSAWPTRLSHTLSALYFFDSSYITFQGMRTCSHIFKRTSHANEYAPTRARKYTHVYAHHLHTTRTTFTRTCTTTTSTRTTSTPTSQHPHPHAQHPHRHAQQPQTNI